MSNNHNKHHDKKEKKDWPLEEKKSTTRKADSIPNDVREQLGVKKKDEIQVEATKEVKYDNNKPTSRTLPDETFTPDKRFDTVSKHDQPYIRDSRPPQKKETFVEPQKLPRTVVQEKPILPPAKPPERKITVPNSVSYPVKKNQSVAIPLAADRTGEVGTVTFDIAQQPTYGQLLFTSVGQYNYAPKTDYVGKDRFTYSAKDDVGTKSNEGTIEITVSDDLPPKIRYQLRKTTQKGDPVTEEHWENVYDSGIIA